MHHDTSESVHHLGQPVHHHSHTFTIVVNGEQKETHHERLSFQEVCEIAFPHGPFGEHIRYTVTYTYPDGREGSMTKGTTVEVQNDMVFYVGNTDRS